MVIIMVITIIRTTLTVATIPQQAKKNEIHIQLQPRRKTMIIIIQSKGESVATETECCASVDWNHAMLFAVFGLCCVRKCCVVCVFIGLLD